SGRMSPRSRASRLDLPVPLPPTRPIFSPAFRLNVPFSNSNFAPRRSVTLLKLIMGKNPEKPTLWAMNRKPKPRASVLIMRLGPQAQGRFCWSRGVFILQEGFIPPCDLPFVLEGRACHPPRRYNGLREERGITRPVNFTVFPEDSGNTARSNEKGGAG